jgi:hypothetical protein
LCAASSRVESVIKSTVIVADDNVRAAETAQGVSLVPDASTSEVGARPHTGTATRHVRARLQALGQFDFAGRSTLALCVCLAAGGVLLYHETRGTTLWFDEWTWVLQRRGGSLSTFLSPHNEHLSLVPVTIYKLLFATAGIGDYRPYRVIVIACQLLVVTLVFVYARRRVGGFLALAGALLILFLGPGWQNFIWPFQIGWLISLAAGLAAFLSLDREDRRGNVAACILATISLASSGVGVAFALGLAVELGLRRARWSELWIVAIPLALYALWWLGYQQTNFDRHSIVLAPSFVANEAASVMAGLLGLGGPVIPSQAAYSGTLLQWGPPLIVAGAVVLVWRLLAVSALRPRVFALLTVAGSFWLLTALSRATETFPFASRYIYVGGLLVVLIAVELARGGRVPGWLKLVLGVAIAAVLASNVGALRAAAGFLRGQGSQTAAALAALDLTRGTVSPNFVATGVPGFPFVVVRAGQYFAAQRRLGSPAASAGQLAGYPEDARLVADSELVAIHRIAVQPVARAAPSGMAPTVDITTGGSAAKHGGCVDFTPDPVSSATAPADALAVTMPPRGVTVSVRGGPAALAIRRFAAEFQPLGTLAAGRTGIIRIAPDLAPEPWHLRIMPAGTAIVCGLAR